MPNERLSYLFGQYVQGNCSPAEKRELSALVLEMQHDAGVQELLEGYWQEVTEEMKMPEETSNGIIDAILKSETKVPRIQFNMGMWWAAAAILVLFTTGSYFLFFNTRVKKGEEVISTVPVKDILAPSTNRAVITLADGSTMYLDSMRDGQLATQGSVQVMKLANGKIAYKPIENGRDNAVQYNTLSNPRGSKVIDLTLADGSHVWLNAGSSVTYPVAFTTNVRRVSVTGEAYFEVAPDKRKPFQVARGNITVEVLGTHFNVNAYDDEPDMKVTLLEGSVRVSVKDSPSNSQDVTIKPGEQAVVANKIEVKRNADLDEVMAWKEGKFSFGKKTDLESIMRQLARWYNIEVIYQDPIDVHFGGIISRQVNVSEVLHKIELTGSVHFTINGDKIIVRK